MVAFSSLRTSALAISLLSGLTGVVAAPARQFKDHSPSLIQRDSGSNSFAGTSNYYLAALDKQTQIDYLNTLQKWNIKVLRIWVDAVSTGTNVKGSEIPDDGGIPAFETNPGSGNYNTQALDRLDDLMALCAPRGIKVIISPHNGNAFGNWGICDAYCKKNGGQPLKNLSGDVDAAHKFYQNPSDYDNRLQAILTYKSKNFNNTPWSQLSEVIFGFDIENEPFVQAQSMAGNDGGWMCGRAQHMKSFIQNSPIAITTGGLGGSVWDGHWTNFDNDVTNCGAIDIISVHSYLGDAGDWKNIINYAQQNTNNKLFMIEEWGVEIHDDFDAQAQAINDLNVPWVYWQVIPAQEEQGGKNTGDYELSVNGAKAGALQQASQQAANTRANQDFSKFLAMSGSAPSTTPSGPTATAFTDGSCSANPGATISCDGSCHQFGGRNSLAVSGMAGGVVKYYTDTACSQNGVSNPIAADGCDASFSAAGGPALSFSCTLGSTSSPQPTCAVAVCQWQGHCFGAQCSSDNDCDGSLACDNGSCGCSN